MFPRDLHSSAGPTGFHTPCMSTTLVSQSGCLMQCYVLSLHTDQLRDSCLLPPRTTTWPGCLSDSNTLHCSQHLTCFVYGQSYVCCASYACMLVGRCVSLEQRLEEVHSQQPAVSSGLTPQQEEEHAAEVQHLQQQIQRLHQESDVYR